ncbi:hypothetical protein A3J19_04080 [Candidatus Daviesbacteria bacterium RIFCSPLOWO2_02_FULL_41_8]|uniref:Uncharacterized protein n=2 Tax=Candidatus Daviesiibacteriota TaxID=1752718 RepID=A0A1F5NIU8_9BACT|nr:MAG: hypothetical protein A2871_02305 [Candidatus Daviesbacteria bacterium RIFCSPHIGHO2_01_FULL_41_23]OGE77555.1 MAG: hypothetical protein A3J19_04080 [Candidatus Daviesbacteria bacterium RIFCSPLOWO2_02_FULL_41_8]
MSEIFRSKIEPYDIPARDDTPRYHLITRSEEHILATKEELQKRLVIQARFYSPIRLIYRASFGLGTIGSFASLLGRKASFLFVPPEAYTLDEQTTWAGIAIVAGIGLSLMMENRIAKWESRKNEFRDTFGEKIHMLPERFRPSNLLKRLTKR